MAKCWDAMESMQHEWELDPGWCLLACKKEWITTGRNGISHVAVVTDRGFIITFICTNFKPASRHDLLHIFNPAYTHYFCKDARTPSSTSSSRSAATLWPITHSPLNLSFWVQEPPRVSPTLNAWLLYPRTKHHPVKHVYPPRHLKARKTSAATQVLPLEWQTRMVYLCMCSAYIVFLSSFAYLGTYRTVVIDAGKNFQAAALEWFPKYQLRRIDALLITHAHADGKHSQIFFVVCLCESSEQY